MMHIAGHDDHSQRLYRRGEIMQMERAALAETIPGHSGRSVTSPGLTALVNLAELHAARGNFPDAVRLLRRVIKAEEEAVGAESLLLVPRLHALAAVLDSSGDHHEAVCVRERILHIQSHLEEV